jgi:hypothetical protein
VSPEQQSTARTAPNFRPRFASQIEEARGRGYSDDEILSHLGATRQDLAPKIKEAQSQGHEASDIVGHLMKTGGAPFEDRAVRDQLKSEGFLDSAWGSIKSPFTFMGHLAAEFTDAVIQPSRKWSATSEVMNSSAGVMQPWSFSQISMNRATS